MQINGKVAAALNDIVTKARQVDELAAEVASASREQTQGITQINTAVGQMDKVTQSNAAGAEESAAAAEELNAQAYAMKDSVGELLKLVGGENQISTAQKPVAAQSKKERTAPTTASKRQVSVNGNGHSHAKPETASVGTPNRNEIPLEDGFKDF